MYTSCHLFSAELLVEERIEYNDLAKSLQNENISYGNKQNDIPTIEDEDDDPKNGLFR